MPPHRSADKTRGAVTNPAGRFDIHSSEGFDDGWTTVEEELPPLKTTLFVDTARSIINRNDSPDVGFALSMNPYRGCEHGCIYCYARPAHAYLNLSPGLDFETKLFYKPDAAKLLAAELAKPGYRCQPIHIGGNTDPYQPVERELEITRGLLEVARRFNQPITIITKSTLIERDIDVLADLARDGLCAAAVSITSLDPAIKRTLEPRAASPAGRLRAVRRMADAGIPVGVMVAPVVPAVTDHEMERILEAAAQAGARTAGYILMRLPHEVKDLFKDWLQANFPDRAEHVMSLVRQARGGKENDPRWVSRMTGTGPYAELLGQRFDLACKRGGLNLSELPPLDTTLFAVPARAGDQLALL